MNYPSPCDSCQTVDCRAPKNCAKYQMYIRSWWKRFNGIYKELCFNKPGVSERFVYLHPDEYRRYITKSPCDNCKAKENCVHPCATYWGWWDDRQEWHRRRFSRR